MKIKTLALGVHLLAIPLLLLMPLCAHSQQMDTTKVSKELVMEAQYVPIQGIEQWVTIKGNRSKPIILFVHGGPGSTISPYIDVLYKDLEKDFIVVQWDQRGSGRTYGRNNPPEELTPEYLQAHPLTLEQMTDDGIAVSEYLLKHLGKRKLILFGSSWGSALGVKIVSKRPDLFYAYVGHSQIVTNAFDAAFYDKIYQIAQQKNDAEALQILTTIGKPPYDRAKKSGQLLRIVKKYESANATPPPANWFVLAPEYDNETDNKNRSDGDDYSFVNFAGDTKLGVASMAQGINLLRDNVDFKIPVYLIQGEADLLTPKDKSKQYFDKITAPDKKYYLLPKAAHGFNESVVETQYKIFKAIKTL